MSIEFSRQEYWNGLPFPTPGDLPDPEIEPGSPALQADSLSSKPPGKPFNLPISSQLPGVMGTSIVIHDYYCPILLTGRLTHGGVK